MKSVYSIMLSLSDTRLKDILTVMTSPPMHDSSPYRNRSDMYGRLDSLNKRSSHVKAHLARFCRHEILIFAVLQTSKLSSSTLTSNW
jgi:hypothetical protein